MKRNKYSSIAWIVCLGVFTLSSIGAFAAEKEKKSASSKDIHFEDSVIEGMNQNSKDSLETIGKRDAADRPHLYKKRQHYKDEIRVLSRELGQQP